ncbi:MAG TPA: S66 peptidase family protein [Rhabdochlamydiaceae bacterium]|nr:S66 peptidase family protein [Rhabdochlamydiaceae bacterium]HSX38582.1 S66 peptidase family protein [Chlamydiales bacterium]
MSPSSGMPFLFPWVYKQGLNRIREIFKLVPVEFPTACQSPEYLSQNPEARAKDINEAFSDPSIKGIIATIGGIDQIRILPYLDKEIISRNPKIFMGYSDCTNLHLFLWNLGIISYYGGAVMTQFAMGGGMQNYTIDSIKKSLFHPPIGHVSAASEYSDADLDWADENNLNKKRPVYPSKGWYWHNTQEQIIEGRLWGGCLEVLDLHLSVRRYLPAFEKLDGSILFLETSEEMPSEGLVYCFISALAEIGFLQRFKAILMAYPKAQFCDRQPPEGRDAFILNQQNAVKNALKDYNIALPVIFNMNFGHTDPQIIIPNGGDVRIDCAAKTIEFH